MAGYVQAVPRAELAPGPAFAHGQGARVGWLVGVASVGVLARVRELAGVGTGPVELSPLASTPVTCDDIRAQAAAARDQGSVVVADVSDYGPEGCPAVRLGAHVSVMGISERLCVVALSKDASRALPSLAGWLDAHAVADETDLCLALQTIEREARRWHKASDAAQVVACYLRCHPKVAELCYPGLKQDRSFAVAARTLQQGFGPRVDFLLAGSGEWTSVTCTIADPKEQVLALEKRLLSCAV